jgi:hypothetical protein
MILDCVGGWMPSGSLIWLPDLRGKGSSGNATCIRLRAVCGRRDLLDPVFWIAGFVARRRFLLDAFCFRVFGNP